MATEPPDSVNSHYFPTITPNPKHRFKKQSSSVMRNSEQTHKSIDTALVKYLFDET